MDLKQYWQDQARSIVEKADAENRALTDKEKSKVDDILVKIEQVKTIDRVIEFVDGNADPERPATEDGAGATSDLYSAIKAQGFDRKSHPVAEVPVTASLSMRAKAGSFNGTLGTGGVMDMEPSPELGHDQRFLYPNLRVVPIPSDATSVQSYRQRSRTLASAATMIRNVDAVTAKPETATVSELVAAEVKQIATISSGTPNVLLENTAFRGWVQQDLTLAYREAVDYHVITAIAAATTTTSTGGPNNYEDILYAQSAVAAQGYTASVVVLSPSDALGIQLLQMASGVTYAFNQTPPQMVVTANVADGAGFVLDPAACGTLYLSPARFAVFEENAGSTNSSTARFESHGVFVVQRPTAIGLLSGAS